MIAETQIEQGKKKKKSTTNFATEITMLSKLSISLLTQTQKVNT